MARRNIIFLQFLTPLLLAINNKMSAKQDIDLLITASVIFYFFVPFLTTPVSHVGRILEHPAHDQNVMSGSLYYPKFVQFSTQYLKHIILYYLKWIYFLSHLKNSQLVFYQVSKTIAFSLCSSVPFLKKIVLLLKLGTTYVLAIVCGLWLFARFFEICKNMLQ